MLWWVREVHTVGNEYIYNKYGIVSLITNRFISSLEAMSQENPLDRVKQTSLAEKVIFLSASVILLVLVATVATEVLGVP